MDTFPNVWILAGNAAQPSTIFIKYPNPQVDKHN